MSSDFQVTGTNNAALFTLKVHRGDWRGAAWHELEEGVRAAGRKHPYKEPGSGRTYALKNRLGFLSGDSKVNPATLSTNTAADSEVPLGPLFPRNAELDGDFIYHVTPVFMNALDERSVGEPQQISIELRRETYPGVLNVAFTRGFVSSQGPSTNTSRRPTASTRWCRSGLTPG